MRKLVAALAVAAVVGLFMFFYQSASYSSRTGEDTPLYSVRRHDPYGTAALFDLLTQRGVSVQTLERPRLDPSDHGVLIQVLADDEASRNDFHLATADLIDWMSRGNTVVQLTRADTDLLQSVKLPPTTRPASHATDLSALHDYEKLGGPPDDAPAVHELVDTTLPGSPQLLLWSPATFDIGKGSAWKPLARLVDEQRSVVAAELKVGHGKLVVVGAPTPAINATLGEEGNLDFLLAVIGDAPVILDEWSHGIGHERTVISFLRDVGLLPVLFQVAVVTGLYVWSTSGHVTPAEPVEHRPRSSVEQVETLGYLYSRSLGRPTTFDRVKQEVERRLAAALRCPPRDLPARAATLSPPLQARLRQLLDKLNALRAGPSLACPSCGYDLSFSVSNKCPECGTLILPELRGRLADALAASKTSAMAANQSLSATPGRSRRATADLADVLTASHQIALEVIRERRSAR